jgi:hypothetical protein
VQTGIQRFFQNAFKVLSSPCEDMFDSWIPAFAGMTAKKMEKDK